MPDLGMGVLSKEKQIVNIKELEHEKKLRRGALDRCEAHYQAYRCQLIRLAEDQVEKELGKGLKEAQDALNKATLEWQNKNDRLALKRVILLYPEGTVLYEWACQLYESQFSKTGRKAILQVFHRDDECLTKWDKPRVGTLIIRSLLKSGKVGKHITRFDTWHQDHWLPEGQVHPLKKTRT